MTLPIMAFVAICIAATIGRPFVFWQQRPGLGGRPFRLYKFRTMNAAYTSDGRALSDDERMSRIGNFLRRTRLDELPQLFNIVLGDMSFIGPRPLLPRDQDDAYRARLLLRPGLTGWAQVVGGRAISAEDKAALDVWYVRHASVLLDLKVVLKTIPIVLFGETISRHLIERAWSDLREAGVLRGRIAQMEPRQGRAAA
jgi:lipopolysaccharide/colanic/teichoic acid biosynthesis glycosyltransferase